VDDAGCAFGGDERSLDLRLASLGHVAIPFTRDEKWPFLRVNSKGMHEGDDLHALCFKELQKPCTTRSKESLISARNWHCRRGAAAHIPIVDAITVFAKTFSAETRA
jgi:hypothetical protein